MLDARADHARFFYSYIPGVQQYNDSGSRADRDLSAWKPALKNPLPQYLGQTPAAGHLQNYFVPAFSFLSGAQDTIAVLGGPQWWEQIWGSSRADDYAVWGIKKDKVPIGFHCLSPAFFKKDRGRAPPTTSEVQGQVLVKSDLVEFIDAEALVLVWNDRGSGASQDVSIYTLPDHLGAFAFPNYGPPPKGTSYPMINLSKGLLVKPPK
ncbi:uncharacterized protein LOC9652601 [Selaginella moellendorffii]|uniref:uncharacterized protein LOC9652601 n=1 Tax=Selaginella moellendorffii TaxID=88036 RepID=UPI000D1CB1DC|nr:uncharacterized protein LOC9652601 [Selaginella moellendorffii]|eukprot:XP_024527327.1 uncharacterized protein LOC9652601 [Selaginella moellendorffii]